MQILMGIGLLWFKEENAFLISGSRYNFGNALPLLEWLVALRDYLFYFSIQTYLK